LVSLYPPLYSPTYNSPQGPRCPRVQCRPCLFEYCLCPHAETAQYFSFSISLGLSFFLGAWREARFLHAGHSFGSALDKPTFPDLDYPFTRSDTLAAISLQVRLVPPLVFAKKLHVLINLEFFSRLIVVTSPPPPGPWGTFPWIHAIPPRLFGWDASSSLLPITEPRRKRFLPEAKITLLSPWVFWCPTALFPPAGLTRPSPMP